MLDGPVQVDPDAVGTPTLGRPGRIALWLWGIHLLLLFFPPIPPHVKGSLWSYLLAAGAVLAGSLEVWFRAPALAARWRAQSTRQRLLLPPAVAGVVLASGFALRAALPELFHRWSDDEGVYEPATIFAHITAALTILAVARSLPGDERRHLRFIAIGYFALVMEEVDYFGIFGGIIGRIDGVYVGSLHDLLHLWSEGGLSTAWGSGLGAAAIVGCVIAWRRRYLQPVRLARLLASRTGLWFLAGVALMIPAQGMDLGQIGFGGSRAMLEELFELTTATFWLALALEIAAKGLETARPKNGRHAAETSVTAA